MTTDPTGPTGNAAPSELSTACVICGRPGTQLRPKRYGPTGLAWRCDDHAWPYPTTDAGSQEANPMSGNEPSLVDVIRGALPANLGVTRWVEDRAAPADIWSGPCECEFLAATKFKCDGRGTGEDHLCRWCRRMCDQSDRNPGRPE